MLDIAFIRNNPEKVKEGIRKKRMKMLVMVQQHQLYLHIQLHRKH